MQNLLVTMLLILTSSTSVYCQGFGSSWNPFKRPAYAPLSRTLPPVVAVSNSSVKLDIKSTGSAPQEVVSILSTQIKGEISGAARTSNIRWNDINPDITIRCVVTGFELVEQNRVEGTGSNGRAILAVIGNIFATIEVFNHRANPPAVIHGSNITHKYEEEFDVKTGKATSWNLFQKADRIPTHQERIALLTQFLARRVAQRIVPIEDTFYVPLVFGGEFKEARSLAESQRWGDMVTLAKTMKQFDKPTDNSYIHYTRGLAEEAVAYTKLSDPNMIQETLGIALSEYSKARKLNPKDVRFIQAEIRARESLEQYEALTNPIIEFGAPEPGGSDTKTVSDVFDNSYLIQQKSAGRSDDYLMNRIKTVATPQFDDSPNGEDELFRNGMSEAVVLAVSQRMAAVRAEGKTSPVPSAPKPASAAKGKRND